MAAAKALIACRVHQRSRHHRAPEAASAALRLIDHLASMQGADGLFDGENLASPPDTAFTINDLCDAYGLLEQSQASAEAAAKLERIATSAKESLLNGGVHTPNHRWELSAALARMHRHWPDRRLVGRVDQWLAEGIDIADDGMYSERSANYALHVSNPSLIAVGTILDRPELLDDVVRNLEAIAATTLPDGTVETVHSRRQDQRGTIDLAGFLMQFRRFAIQRGRGDFAGIVAEILARPRPTRPAPSPRSCSNRPWPHPCRRPSPESRYAGCSRQRAWPWRARTASTSAPTAVRTTPNTAASAPDWRPTRRSCGWPGRGRTRISPLDQGILRARPVPRRRSGRGARRLPPARTGERGLLPAAAAPIPPRRRPLRADR
ncbi:hypothetical protein GCM10029992_05490 [Glycomyces albus]